VKGYTSNGWLTKNQINAAGGSIRKGEQTTWVIFWKPMMVDDKDRPGEQKKVLLQRVYMVWNVDQCENLPEKYTMRADFVLPEGTLEARMKALGVVVKAGPPAFHPELDYITMPKPEQFSSMDSYRSTEAHEVIHWTGHKSRLNRKTLVERTSVNYNKEELVAELGSAILCTMLGIKLDGLQHAGYLQHYIDLLRADPMILLQTAGVAQVAVDYVMGVKFENKDAS
jgi:antirestriction protein ArdC